MRYYDPATPLNMQQIRFQMAYRKWIEEQNAKRRAEMEAALEEAPCCPCCGRATVPNGVILPFVCASCGHEYPKPAEAAAEGAAAAATPEGIVQAASIPAPAGGAADGQEVTAAVDVPEVIRQQQADPQPYLWKHGDPVNLQVIQHMVNLTARRRPELLDELKLRGLSLNQARLAIAVEIFGEDLNAPLPDAAARAAASGKPVKLKDARVWQHHKGPASASSVGRSSKPAKHGTPSAASSRRPSSQPTSPRPSPSRRRISA